MFRFWLQSPHFGVRELRIDWYFSAETTFRHSVHVRKLTQVEQHTTEILETVGLGVGVKGGQFLGGGRAAGCELVGAATLAF